MNPLGNVCNWGALCLIPVILFQKKAGLNAGLVGFLLRGARRMDNDWMGRFQGGNQENNVFVFCKAIS